MIMTCLAVTIIIKKDVWHYYCVVAPVRNTYFILKVKVIPLQARCAPEGG